jgi:acyl-lipid omega-6 desaturase (Delta-12 desaturase)
MKTDKNKIQKTDWTGFAKKRKEYETPSLKKSIWQIINTFIPYIGLWILIIYSLSVLCFFSFFLIVLAAGFLVRLFIIFHDCGHGSFFKSEKANRIVGTVFGILAFTPYHKWHNLHMKHHATVGNLSQRGLGDVWTMTRHEFVNGSRKKQLGYRLYRNPWIMFGLGPLYMFLINHRLTGKWMNRKQKINVHLTTLILIILTIGMSLLIGFSTFLIIQLSILYIAGMAGLWLFYLQHQFEDVIWLKNEEWNYQTVALEGSSFVKFPKILQWFSGNIGFHHIHHISSRIPNYNLPGCYKEMDVFKVKPVTFWDSLKTLRLRLWDEDSRRLIGFNEVNG